VAKYEFVSTHGVEFGEEGPADKAGKPGPYVIWAAFVRDRSLDTPEGEKRYTFSTDDAKVADRVRSAEGFGITEVSPAAPDAE